MEDIKESDFEESVVASNCEESKDDLDSYNPIRIDEGQDDHNNNEIIYDSTVKVETVKFDKI